MRIMKSLCHSLIHWFTAYLAKLFDRSCWFLVWRLVWGPNSVKLKIVVVGFQLFPKWPKMCHFGPKSNQKCSHFFFIKYRLQKILSNQIFSSMVFLVQYTHTSGCFFHFCEFLSRKFFKGGKAIKYEWFFSVRVKMLKSSFMVRFW